MAKCHIFRVSSRVVYPDAWDSHYGLLIEGVRQEIDELRDHYIIPDFHIVPGFKHGEWFVQMVQQLADKRSELSSDSDAILVGSRENIENIHKVEGFDGETKRLSLMMVGVYETGDAPEMAYPVTARIFAEHPDQAGLYIATINVEGVRQYRIDHDLAGKVKVIATGNSTEVMNLIDQGVIQCSPFQNEQKQGCCAIQALKQWFEGNEKPDPAEI